MQLPPKPPPIITDGLDPAELASWDAQKIQLVRDTALERFDFFCAAVLNYAVTEFHAKMIAHRFAHRSNMVLAPRGSGKSTILDVAYIIWRVIKNPNLRICIASKTGPQSKSFLGQIKQHFENNEVLTFLFGDCVGDTWNEDEIIVKGRTKILKEPTICAKAVGAGIPGFHFDMIIADDLVDLENSATQLQRDKMLNWFLVVLEPTLEPNGEMYVIGTRYHPDDIYGFFAAKKKDGNGRPSEKWNKKKFGPNTLVIPAITVNDVTGEEECFWPEYFDIDDLRELREENLLAFNLAYQNDASIQEGGIMRIEDLMPYTYASLDEIPPLHEMAIFQGVDPAIGQKQTNDYFAHCTIGVHNNQHIYVLEITKQRIPFNDQVDYILAQQAKWNADLVGIETIAYQKALVMAIKERVTWFPVHEVKPRIDKEMRAKIFSAFVQRHEVHFHYSHYEAMETLVGMPNPSSKHDDLFDAVDIAVEAAKQMVLKQNVIAKLKSNLRRR